MPNLISDETQSVACTQTYISCNL